MKFPSYEIISLHSALLSIMNEVFSHVESVMPVDGFHSIFHHSNWSEKCCDVDINQSAGSMVMQCPPVA